MLLCAGEALIDMLPRKTEGGEAGFAPYPGGSVFNTAVAAARLGLRTGFFSGLSNDLFGERLAAVLTAAGVDHRMAARSARPTTLAFVTLTDGQASYAFYDENTAGRMLTPADLPKLPKDVKAAFFGGISLVVEPCGAAYEALMAREAPSRVVMLDPNIRPGFIRDERAYRARIGRMLALADIVKVSDEDLHWLLGAGSTASLAAEMLRMGPKLLCVTEGAAGARAFSAAGEVFVESRSVPVADTVGAGDTFNAGVLAALGKAGALGKHAVAALSRETVGAALSLGCRAAAVTVSRPGADPPWADEL